MSVPPANSSRPSAHPNRAPPVAFASHLSVPAAASLSNPGRTFGSINDPVEVDVNMDHAWITAHGGFVPRFRADGSTVMYPFESLPPGFPNVPPAYYATFPPPAGTLVPGALTPVQLPDRAARVTADGSSASTAATGSIKARRSSTDAPVSKPAAVQRVDVDPGKSNPETSGASQVMKKSRKVVISDDVIDISSEEDDGAKYLPGDSSYRGRASASRIKLGGPGTSPPVTRAVSRRRSTTPGSGLASREPQHNGSSGDPVLPGNDKPDASPAKPRPRPRRRNRPRARGPAVVVSSGDEVTPTVNEIESPPVVAPGPNNVAQAQDHGSRSVDKSPRAARSGGDEPVTPDNVHQEAGPLGDRQKKRVRDLRDTGSGSDSGERRRSKKNAAVVYTDDHDSDVPVGTSSLAPGLGELVKTGIRKRFSKEEMARRVEGLQRSSTRWSKLFLDMKPEDFMDVEAIEDNGPDQPSVPEDDMTAYKNMDLDKYESSFIDDEEESESEELPALEDIFKSGDEREDGDDDANDLPLGYYLSQCLRSSALVANTIIRFDDFVRAHEEKTKEQIRDDRAMAMAIERHNTIVEQSLLNRREMPVDDAADPCANTDLEQAAIPEEDDPFGVKRLQREWHAAVAAQLEAQRRAAVAAGVREDEPSIDERPATPPPPPSSHPTVPRTPAASSSTANKPTVYNPTPSTPGLSTPGGRRRFGELVGVPSTPGSGGQERWSPATLPIPHPDVCEVTSDSLHDPLLADDYAKLSPLRRGMFVPYNNNPGTGMVWFSGWAEQTPDLDADAALNSLRFVRKDNYINPSRASNDDIKVKRISPGSSSGSPRFHFYVDEDPVIFKMLQAKFHSQEWERFVAFTCMLVDKPALHANLSRDAISFVTRPVSGNRRDEKDNAAASTPSRGMFTHNPSPSTRAAPSNRFNVDNYALDADAEVPIFDARDIDGFNLNSVLPALSLPAWEGEIPFGSFVVVGYTVAVYRAQSGKWTASCNIHWVIVLAVPCEADN
ncbi:hypothetical protein CC1G_04817 [Coprinopsis cinerea okayama7|uniref:Uncharacterized protein n=1 Tax=Coprinopsis cinerea (strain Okayama-7 / 130 / ATCC MYA-4618 / FGSC 9003) TaxID=240176 RepID=A8P2N9_COPC7|nr:hypothetical protein CC1G_04817 [Coprinopsis cinerea okayama7\|eukprot:XP_001838373.2 hypothetical protein CC1G_04817 [Coprinopsis cinerea okayama7\